VGDITRSQVQSEFNLTEKTANNRLNKLVKEGLVIQTGKGRSTKYKIS
jgi:predicted HTH transcriptional regulator